MQHATPSIIRSPIQIKKNPQNRRKTGKTSRRATKEGSQALDVIYTEVTKLQNYSKSKHVST